MIKWTKILSISNEDTIHFIYGHDLKMMHLMVYMISHYLNF